MLLAFLWFNEINQPVTPEATTIYIFTRVPLGEIPRPLLLHATVAHHLNSTSRQFHSQLSHDIYVDNLITDASNTKEARKLQESATTLFATAERNLRA